MKIYMTKDEDLKHVFRDISTQLKIQHKNLTN